MTPEERRILRFEEAHPEGGIKARAEMRAQLGLRGVTYTQKLVRALAKPEALVEFPMVVHRLERRAAAAAELRAGKRFA